MIDIRQRVRTTAFHEAGHALAAVHFGIPFSRLWILKRTDFEDRRGEILGQLTRIDILNKGDFAGKFEEAKAEAALAFCGPMAECLAYPEQLMGPDFINSNLDDWILARSILRFATTPFDANREGVFTPDDLARTNSQVEQLLDQSGSAAEQLVNRNQEAIRRIAEALLDHWELTPDEVRALAGLDSKQS